MEDCFAFDMHDGTNTLRISDRIEEMTMGDCFALICITESLCSCTMSAVAYESDM